MTMQSTQSPVKTSLLDPIDAALADPKTTAELLNRIRYQTGKWYASKSAGYREQVSQELFSNFATRVLEKKANYDPSRSVSPMGWMLGFLPYMLKEYWSEQQKLPTQADGFFDPPAKIGKQFNDIAEDLEYYLDFLEIDDRRLVTMFHIEQRSHREISVLLNLKYDAVRQRCSRAMLKMIDGHAQREGQS